MKVGIIGANSFIAKAFCKEVFFIFSLVLFRRKGP